MLPDLNRLTVFYQVYRHRSFKRAGESLHITQSAVSQHIRKLETEIGYRLFTRSHRQVIPSNAADRLHEVLDPFLEKLKLSLGNLEKEKEAPGGILKVGSPVEFGAKVLTRVLAGFLEKYPDVRFELSFGSRDMLCGLLTENRLDLAFSDVFSEKSPISSLFSMRPIISEHLPLVGTPELIRRLGITPSSSIAELCRAPHLSYLPNYPDLKNWYQLHFKGNNPDLTVPVTVENVQAMITLIKSSLGLGLVPDYLIETELKERKLIEIKPTSAKITNKISLIQLKDKRPSVTEKAFIKYFLNSQGLNR